MKALMNQVKSFWIEEKGATATEYAVMLALIIVLALGAITALGTHTSSMYTQIETAM